jgi:hypothetical protein
MESNPAAYAEHQLSTPAGTDGSDEDQEHAGKETQQAGASPPAECYAQAALVTQSAGAAGTCPSMCESDSARLHICAAPVAPVNRDQCNRKPTFLLR